MTQKETAEERRNIEYSTCEEWLEKIRHMWVQGLDYGDEVKAS